MSWAGTALLAAGLAAAVPVAATVDGIDRHRWTARLLVVVAPDESDAALAEQRGAFAASERGSLERDLVLVEAVGSSAEAQAIRRRFSVPAGSFRAILVGKDGEAKLASDAPIAPERLFAAIDGMPMRRDEMRRAGGR